MVVETRMKQTILIVDDSTQSLAFMSLGLKDLFNVKVAKSGKVALQLLEKFKIDIVLLDIVMPEISGYDVIKALPNIEKNKSTPVIFLTSKNSPDDETLGFKLGATDYIHKPVSLPLLRARVKAHIQNKLSKDTLKDEKDRLEELVIKRSDELDKMQNSVVFALASLAETRDSETGNHLIRTQHYVKIIAEQLALTPKYRNHLTPKMIDTYFKAAPLHDIGKVGIEDAILLKPGKLTDAEFEIMKTHTSIGLKALEKAEQLSGTHSELITIAKEMAFSHHEQWDGSGYPHGLIGDGIPLSARLMALADVYDALRNRRIYKDAFSHKKSKEIIIEGKGKRFDPEVVMAFIEQEKQFIAIADKFSD